MALGTVTGCFGGIARDILLNEIPLIFRKEICASACIAGGTIFYLLNAINIEEKLAPDSLYFGHRTHSYYCGALQTIAAIIPKKK